MTDSNGNKTREAMAYIVASLSLALGIGALGHQAISTVDQNRKSGDDALASLIADVSRRNGALEDARVADAYNQGKRDAEMVGLRRYIEDAKTGAFTHSDTNRAQLALGIQQNAEKIAALEAASADLRERTRGISERLTGAFKENESQHQRVAGEAKLRNAINRLMALAYWDGARIVFPEVSDADLEGIGEGEVETNGNGHK